MTAPAARVRVNVVPVRRGLASRAALRGARAAVLTCAACLVLAVSGACNGILAIPMVELAVSDGAAASETSVPDGSVACAPGQKSCGAVCVSILDPATGCAGGDCAPCTFPHAKVACIMGECAIETCEEGFGNCNAVRADGCEVDLRVDSNNCMACGSGCGGFDCAGGNCVCNNDGQCGNGGVCDTQLCTCGGNTCSAGSPCSDMTTCAF